MPKPVRAASRFALGAVAALALVFGGLTAPAFADDLPVEPPVSESDSVETPTAPVEEDAPEDSDAPAEGEAEEAGETVPAGEDAESPESQEPSTAMTDTATDAETGTLFGASAMSTMDADDAAPTVTVSKTTGLARDGETITVSGTGFVNAGAATTGTRPPLAGKFTGAYIVFGKFADSWKPTDNAASSARFGIETRWGVLAEDLATIGGEAAGGVVIEADGSFSITMTVSATIANDIKVGNYGIYTYAAGGAKYAPFETYTPLAFTVAAPQVFVSKVSDLDWGGETITVSGTGFVNAGAATTGMRPPLAGKFTGAYVAFGKFLDTWKPTENAAASARKTIVTKWAVQPEDLATIGGADAGGIAIGTNGSFSFTIEVSASVANDVLAGNYGIYSYAAGGAKYAPFETYTPIEFAVPTPQVFVSKTSDLDRNGEAITVSGTGFVNAGAATTGTRPPLAGKFTGAYVAFGKFLDTWKPTENAASSARKTIVTKWAVQPEDLATIGGADAGGIAIGTNGSFSFTIEVSASVATDVLAGNYGIYSYAAGGAKYAPFEIYTPISFAPASATTTSLTAGATTLTAGQSTTLAVSVTPTSIAGTVRFTDGSTVLGTVAVSAGTASLTVSPTAGAHAYQAQFLPTNTSTHTASSSAVVNVQVNAAPSLAAGSLSWAIKGSFNEYLVTTAAGTISLSGGASAFGSGYHFPQTSGDWSASTQTGTVAFAGSVHYYGHGGALDVTFSNPTIVVHSASSATLYLNGVAFANLSLAAASKSVGAGGDVTWSGVPATLTSGGAAAFAGFYNAGDALDPLTFTAGSAASGIGGGTVVVASAQTTDVRTPAPTPPATTGVTVIGTTPAQGGTVTIEAPGFQPNEAGILIVIYSDPVVLGTVTADANGVARWTGKLPSTLSGVHTLTMQGSVSHGVVVTIAPSIVKAAGACTISDATLTWGFKESFRSYLTSTIAHGEWVVADGATYETPNFSWTGTGSLDPETQTGDVAFDGSVLFTGHDGALQTTIANPRVVLSADGAVIMLDITGTTQSGAEVNSLGVEFATLDLSSVTPEENGDALTWNAIPAVLTEAGSAAFGTYAAGEALDPVTLSLSLPADCGAAAAEETPAPEVTTAIDNGTTGPDLTWLWWLIGGLVVLAIVIAIIVTVLRRRNAA